MGTRKKTQSSIINGGTHATPNTAPSSLFARNLRKSQLGGVIFGCKNSTIRECLLKQLFGLPAHHFSYVKNIDPGLPLFLFNYSDRKLHGIFEAACPGQMNINPYGWTTDGSERTLYPAQVQIRVRLQCQPLLESQFKQIIGDNYYNQHHFWFELDHAQTSKLVSLLASFAVAPGTSVLQNTMKWRSIFPASSSRDTSEESEEFPPLGLESEHLKQSSQRSDSSSTDVVSSFDGESQPLEAQFNVKVVQQGEKDLIYMKLKKLASKHEVNDERQDLSLRCDAKDISVTNGTHLETDDVENASVTNDISSKNKGYPGEPLGVEDNYERNPVPSSKHEALITQLIHEVEELKTFKAEQTQKMSFLQQKLMQAETEIQLLKRHLNTDSESYPSTVLHDEKVIGSFADLNLDPNESIFLFGGYDGESWLSAFDSYYPSQNVLKSLKPTNSARSYASVAQLNGEIYAIGGGNGHVWYDTVESYNPAKDQWTLRPSLNQRKGSLAAASSNNKIFAMGGGNGLECFSNVEMLDLDVGRWMHARSMQQKRFSLAAAELNGIIYAVGGYDGTDYLKSAERFDPREHSWKNIPSMNTRRGCHSLVVFNEKLYALGGYDGSNMVSSVEIFDPRLGSWMTGVPMNYSRGYSVAAAVKDTIYVIGGVKDGYNIVNEIESFKEGWGWHGFSRSAIGKRCFHSGIVLSP
ncbi:Development/cell death domain containing protein [Trema orientale]|uniref:Development/cell death domain containing protein n=1 Tax=Trema orientale TaxID=63057 RepID=A0A2P5F9C1_TREOI|nr:Development/cell death domain containing protein [Trema orientale]